MMPLASTWTGEDTITDLQLKRQARGAQSRHQAYRVGGPAGECRLPPSIPPTDFAAIHRDQAYR